MDYKNQKFDSVKPWLTFFTPTYNRRNTISRCYESLKNMKKPTGVEFEWIIIDDGSTDDTASLIKEWADENIIPIRYHYKPNGGKHTAINKAVELARGEMLAILDSDDTFMDNALIVFWEGWQSIPAAERSSFKGVTARCKDPHTGLIVGSPLPRQPYYVHSQDMRFKDHVTGEMCGINRVDVMREFPFPVFTEKTSFCPEAIVWFEMGKKYKESIIDVAVREYFRDADNSIMNANSGNRAKANYHLWKYEVNNIVGKYIMHSPVEMTKALVGMTMDGLRSGRTLRSILGDVDKPLMRLAVALLVPAGYILSHRK